MIRPDLSHGMRSPALAGRMAAKLVYGYAFPLLVDGACSPLKVRTVADQLGLGRKTVRRALAELCAADLLTCTTPPTGGTPGEYMLGPAAWRHTGRDTRQQREPSDATAHGRKTREPSPPD
ncbi:helix-turn-helix domain-containing protein [Gemmatimonas sp.]|uniref:helix-turn-helix domain-containing protein n=1 Tax=Gemmatimonas sp. TaxID=1962908 RepID=UPI0037C0B61B